jgi:hypothetical protein
MLPAIFMRYGCGHTGYHLVSWSMSGQRRERHHPFPLSPPRGRLSIDTPSRPALSGAGASETY